MKKFFAFALIAVALGVLSSCDRPSGIIPGVEEIQHDKTQLYITNFDGGVGTDWLYKAKKMYEDLHKDDVYEEGKKGVQIMIDPNKNDGMSMLSTFKGSTYDIVFNEGIKYHNWVAEDLFLDITDVVKSTYEGENRTIEDKLYDEQKGFLLKNDKYYALPHYCVFQSVIYNIDLFEKKGLYFAKEEDNGNNGFVVLQGEERSCGPDGIYNTQDDGLPSSYEEFFKLCDYMVTRGVTPFVWTGQHANTYTQFLLNVVYQTYEGQDDVMLNYTFNSGDQTTEIITNITNGQLVTENIKITPENGNLLKKQTGRYYAIDFLSNVLSKSSYYHSYSTGNLTFSHTDAQELYLESDLKNEPIAFLIDGTWWENESVISNAYERTVNKYGSIAENRNFGCFPMPSQPTGRVEEGQGKTSVLMDHINAFAGINSGIASFKVDLAKDFLKFCYSDEILQLFTEVTGIPKGLQYSLTDGNLSKMSTFAKSVWDMKVKSDIIYPSSSVEFFVENQTELTVDEWFSTVGGSFEQIYIHLKNKKNTNEIFMGHALTDQNWRDKYFYN